MEYARLGRSDITVSRICLGTMNFGEQNTEAEAHAQLDAALDAGVTFIDTAEIYPVPPRAETYGATEVFIGNWLAARGNRDKVVLATKVAGPNPNFSYVREGRVRHDREGIEAALDASLKRLQTDYVDLYQIHWPERNTTKFGKLGYTHEDGEKFTPVEETLEVLGDLVKAGKIRAVGLSNEAPWGVMKSLAAAERSDLPRVVSVQNCYNLLNRTYETGLAEVSMREDCGLLAFSPLAFGILSGKYLDDQKPEGARLTLFPQLARYERSGVPAAAAAYVALAREHGLDPAQMAVAWVHSRRFVTSTIIGATKMNHLSASLAASEITLSEDLLAAIEEIHLGNHDPAW